MKLGKEKGDESGQKPFKIAGDRCCAAPLEVAGQRLCQQEQAQLGCSPCTLSASLPRRTASNICKIHTLSQVFLSGHFFFALVCAGFGFHGTARGAKQGTILTILTILPLWDVLKTFPLQKTQFYLKLPKSPTHSSPLSSDIPSLSPPCTSFPRGKEHTERSAGYLGQALPSLLLLPGLKNINEKNPNRPSEQNGWRRGGKETGPQTQTPLGCPEPVSPVPRRGGFTRG